MKPFMFSFFTFFRDCFEGAFQFFNRPLPVTLSGCFGYAMSMAGISSAEEASSMLDAILDRGVAFCGWFILLASALWWAGKLWGVACSKHRRWRGGESLLSCLFKNADKEFEG